MEGRMVEEEKQGERTVSKEEEEIKERTVSKEEEMKERTVNKEEEEMEERTVSKEQKEMKERTVNKEEKEMKERTVNKEEEEEEKEMEERTKGETEILLNREKESPEESQKEPNGAVRESSTTTEDRANNKVTMRVPDGGWGWMVAFGAFLCSVLVLGQSFTFGILFSQYLLSEGVSSTTTGWIFNISLMMTHLMMVLVGPLTKEFGVRTVGYFGTTVCIVAMFLSAFTPSPEFLYFTTSLLGGVGPGLVVSVCYTVVAPYFDKKRGRANTLLVAGSPVAQIVMMPLLRYLLDQYSFKGAALVYSGVMMHVYIGITFFHPLKWHLKPCTAEDIKAQQQQQEQEEEEKTLLPHQGGQEEIISSSDHPHSENSNSLPRHRVDKQTDSLQLVKRRYHPASTKKAIGGSFVSINSCSSDFPVGVDVVVVEGKTYSSCVSLSSSLHGVGDYDNDDEGKDFDNVVTDGGGDGGQTCGVVSRLFHTFVRVGRSIITNLRLYRSLRVCIIAFSFGLSSASFLNFIMVAPFSMQASGHSLQNAAWCLSAMGIVNLLTRFVVSPLADWKKFNIQVCMMLGYFLKAIAAVGFALSVSLEFLGLWTVLFGIGLGATISLQILVIVSYMGMELLPATYGIAGITTAFLFPIAGPLIGLVRDLTESYEPSLYFIGSLDLVSAAMWIFMPAAVTWDNNNNANNNNNKFHILCLKSSPIHQSCASFLVTSANQHRVLVWTEGWSLCLPYDSQEP
ncbi:hypothetical protein Pmani_010149 [Petrolisthes manimaculis]|uniref:Uncharacterized protein n=1 Tax=Petrolisthes manimaculis TaxID=1843537 RepID=A0AAE1UCZ3_9EUCA|nr:hypothetical protein Pmani_010149 [Petrolisthes manimaculis]